MHRCDLAKQGRVHPHTNAAVAELADALASGASGRKAMRVRISPAAQQKSAQDKFKNLKQNRLFIW